MELPDNYTYSTLKDTSIKDLIEFKEKHEDNWDGFNMGPYGWDVEQLTNWKDSICYKKECLAILKYNNEIVGYSVANMDDDAILLNLGRTVSIFGPVIDENHTEAGKIFFNKFIQKLKDVNVTKFSAFGGPMLSNSNIFLENAGFVSKSKMISNAVANIKSLDLSILPSTETVRKATQEDISEFESNVSDIIKPMYDHYKQFGESLGIFVEGNPVRGYGKLIKDEDKYTFVLIPDHPKNYDELMGPIVHKIFLEYAEKNIENIELPPAISPSLQELLKKSGCTFEDKVSQYILPEKDN